MMRGAFEAPIAGGRACDCLCGGLAADWYGDTRPRTDTQRCPTHHCDIPAAGEIRSVNSVLPEFSGALAQLRAAPARNLQLTQLETRWPCPGQIL